MIIVVPRILRSPAHQRIVSQSFSLLPGYLYNISSRIRDIENYILIHEYLLISIILNV